MTRYASVAGLAPLTGLKHAARFALLFAVLLPLILVRIARLSRGDLLALWSGLALAGLVWMAKPGSNTNVLLEPAAVLIVVGGGALERARRRATVAGEAFAIHLAVLGQCVLLLVAVDWNDVEWDLSRAQSPAQQVVSRIEAVPGEVLVEEPGLALVAGKQALIEPFQFALLERAGLWDSRPLVRAVRDGRFDPPLCARTRSCQGSCSSCNLIGTC